MKFNVQLDGLAEGFFSLSPPPPPLPLHLPPPTAPSIPSLYPSADKNTQFVAKGFFNLFLFFYFFYFSASDLTSIE